MDKFFYSEGYIYKGMDAYLEVIGTPKKQEEFGNKVVKLLNAELKKTN